MPPASASTTGRSRASSRSCATKYDSDAIKLHITGFAKVVGDLIDGLQQVLLFLALAIVICTAVLFWYTRCVRSTLLLVACSLVAVVWLLGLLPHAGLRARPVLDPGAVPGVRHRHEPRRAEDERHHAGHRPRHAQAGGGALHLPPALPRRPHGAAGRRRRLRGADGDRHPGHPGPRDHRQHRHGGADLHQPASCCPSCCRTSA